MKALYVMSFNIQYLNILFSMKSYRLCFNFSLFDINFIATKNYGNCLAHTHNVFMPVYNILVRDTRCNIKHNDRALSLNVISVTKTTKFLLTSGVPDIESD